MASGQDASSAHWPSVALFAIVIAGYCQYWSRKRQQSEEDKSSHDCHDFEQAVDASSSPMTPEVTQPVDLASPPPAKQKSILMSGKCENKCKNGHNGSSNSGCNGSGSLPPTWRSGEIIRFCSSGEEGAERVGGGCSWDLLVERLPDSFLHAQQRGEKAGGGTAAGEKTRGDKAGGTSVCVALALPSQPYQRLRISNLETGALDWSGKAADRESCWVVTSSSSSSPCFVTITHNVFSKKKGQGRVYSFVLGCREGAGWIALSVNPPSTHCSNLPCTTTINDTYVMTTNSTATADGSAGVGGTGCTTVTGNYSHIAAAVKSLPQWRVEALQPRKTHRHHHQETRNREGREGRAKEVPIGIGTCGRIDSDLVPAQPLTDAQLLSFVHQGFLVLRQKVPPSVLSAATKAINSRLGQPGGHFVPHMGSSDTAKRRPPSGFDETELPLEHGELDGDGGGVSGGRVQFNGRLGVEASSARELLEPARCPEVHRYIAQMLGGTDQVSPINGVQVALRFPGEGNDVLVLSGAAMKHHVRGDSWHTDGLRQGKKHSFSLLVGIALTDTIVSNNGNLCVWPKSHLHIHHWMRHPDGMIRRIPHSNPSSAIPSVSNSATSTEGESLNVLSVTNCVGYSEASTTHCNTNADKNKTKETGDRDMQCNLVGYRDSDGSLPDLGPPVQVLLRAGDVVFKHSEVGHCGAPHMGSDIRSMLYYRVRHTDWKHFYQTGQLVHDMWCDLPGVSHLADAQALKGGCNNPPALGDCAHVGQVARRSAFGIKERVSSTLCNGQCECNYDCKGDIFSGGEDFESMSTVDVSDLRYHSCIA